LSKAVAKLETELGVKLFERVGRHIEITDHGRFLQMRAAEILRLEETTRSDILGRDASVQIRIAGAELLLAKFGPMLVRDINLVMTRPTFEFIETDCSDAQRRLQRNDVHISLVTEDVLPGLFSKKLMEATFQTCIGSAHPLFKYAKSKKVVPVEEVLKHSFVSSDRQILGKIGAKQSSDGWRDDKFPRRIDFITTNLQLIRELVNAGAAVAYLPDYFVDSIGAFPLAISGCPYTCKQTVRMVVKNPKSIGWLDQIF
jgi:DNA-binding transcriptional LysR family regulator